MIKVENVNKYFNRFKKNKIHVINNTSIEMGKTGLVAILGQSGSGKTTLLNAIGGLDKVNSGKIYVNGKKINSFFSSRTDKIRNLNIGYIFQKFLLIDDMTVFENIALVLKMQGIKDKKEIEKRVEYVLKKVDMETYKNRYPQMLSGGQRQRVAIARAIVKNPNIIIADEPTGNLDSKNSLEVMKIIKAISKEKLVVLVTHEKDLANFFATRIIDIVDGKIVGDRENEIPEDLDYKLDNKIYLKDINIKKKFVAEDIDINYFSDDKENMDVSIVVRNGNIYIRSNTNKKIEVVDENSSIEFVNDHYKKLTKEEQDKYKFDIESMVNKNQKLKYKSIYNIFSLIYYGFKKVFKYPFVKKVLLLGFVISAMFVSYATYNFFGIINIKDEKFITQNKNDIEVNVEKPSVELYNKLRQDKNVNYIIPGNAYREFKIDLQGYQQFYGMSENMRFALACNKILNKEDLVIGRLPENNNEIVVDKLVIDEFLQGTTSKNVGILSLEDVIGRDIIAGDQKIYKKFKIVGVVNKNTRCMYLAEEEIPAVIYYTAASKFTRDDYIQPEQVQTKYEVLDNVEDKIKVVEGTKPKNEFEVILNIQGKTEKKLLYEIDEKIDGKKLKVVGYYKSKFDITDMVVTRDTLNKEVISNSKIYNINSVNNLDSINYIKENNLKGENVYQKDREKYIQKIKKTIITTVISAGVVLAISLIEIYLMMRSSFLSRVKEIGVLRAIGVKKNDIRKRFLGEIFAITILASMPGYIIMTYIMSNLDGLPVFSEKYLVNFTSASVALLIIIIANIIIGTLPLFGILRKTPAEILSRTDVD